jgi:hypothetical protein
MLGWIVEVVGRYSKISNLPKIDILTPVADGPVAHRHIHNARRRLGPEQIGQLVGDYEAGSPSTKLMDQYGLGKGTVLALLRKHGVKLRGQGVRNIDVQQGIELYQAGWSLKQLGAEFDCDAETVRKALRAAGVQMRSPHDRSLSRKL